MRNEKQREKQRISRLIAAHWKMQIKLILQISHLKPLKLFLFCLQNWNTIHFKNPIRINKFSNMHDKSLEKRIFCSSISCYFTTLCAMPFGDNLIGLATFEIDFNLFQLKTENDRFSHYHRNKKASSPKYPPQPQPLSSHPFIHLCCICPIMVKNIPNRSYKLIKCTFTPTCIRQTNIIILKI